VDFHVFMLLFYFALALGVSFMCSLMEAGILSLPRSHAVMLKKQGKRSGVTLEKMKRSIDQSGFAVPAVKQSLGVENMLGVVVLRLHRYKYTAAKAYVVFEGKWIALTSAILTLAILVLSEIIPKTIGAVFCRQIAPLTAIGITAMIYITYPIVIALEQFSKLLPGGQEGARLTREELALLAEMGQIEGAIEGKESQIIQNLLKLQDYRVHDVMTPRKVVQMIQQDRTVGDALTEVEQTGFSRFPLFGKDSDELVGVVLRRDLSDAARKGDQDNPVKTYGREVGNRAERLAELVRQAAHRRIQPRQPRDLDELLRARLHGRRRGRLRRRRPIRIASHIGDPPKKCRT